MDCSYLRLQFGGCVADGQGNLCIIAADSRTV